MSEEDTTTEILRTLHNIVAGFTSELQQVKSTQLTPEDISVIVEAHNVNQIDEMKQLQASVAQLKVKSQQRLSMDPEFMAEIKRVLSETPKEKRSEIVESAAEEHVIDIRAEIKAELQEYMVQLEKKKPKFSMPGPPQPLLNPIYTIKPLMRVRQSRFTQSQEERKKVYLAEIQSRKDRAVLASADTEAALQALKIEIDYANEIKAADEHIKNLEDERKKTKSKAQHVQYDIEIEQAKLKALEIRTRDMPLNKKIRRLESQQRQVELATIRANYYRTSGKLLV